MENQAPVSIQQFISTPILVTPDQLIEMRRKTLRRGFIAGVITTSVWMAYLDYRSRMREERNKFK